MTDSTIAPPTTTPAINGLTLLQALRVATDWVASHRDEVNALNVFPVPDGDTGTNMLLTLREAVAAGADAAREERGAGPIAMAIAGGALIGARGNSGVILCQMIRGFALAVADRATIDGADIGRALAGARDYAYSAVVEPVEGTMLTVIRGAADGAAAVLAADASADVSTVLGAALAQARQSLAATPQMLDVLRAANVVDAGGQGIVHMLDGLTRFAADQALPVLEPAAAGSRRHSAFDAATAHGAPTTGFCVNFLLWLSVPPDLTDIRQRLSAIGTSIDLIAADHALRVHLHTDRPGAALDYAGSLGELDRVEIDNMGVQTRRLRANAGPASPAPPAPPAAPKLPLAPVTPGTVAVLAVATGRRLATALAEMGAAQVIGFDPPLNPSTADLVAGLTAIPTDEIIILPNNPNVIMAAEQAVRLADKTVRVVPTRSVPQGLAALSVLGPERSLAENERRLRVAMDRVRTVEVTYASRDATVNEVAVETGDVIGFVDEFLVASGADFRAVTLAALASAGLATAELITLFTGADLDAATAADIIAAMTAAAPDAVVEHHAGDQPHYPIVIAVE